MREDDFEGQGDDGILGLVRQLCRESLVPAGFVIVAFEIVVMIGVMKLKDAGLLPVPPWVAMVGVVAAAIWLLVWLSVCSGSNARRPARYAAWQTPRAPHTPAVPSSGNQAFDEYRAETLRRLDSEREEFHGFLERLRLAKDKAEFDEFRAARSRPPLETA